MPLHPGDRFEFPVTRAEWEAGLLPLTGAFRHLVAPAGEPTSVTLDRINDILPHLAQTPLPGVEFDPPYRSRRPPSTAFCASTGQARGRLP